MISILNIKSIKLPPTYEHSVSVGFQRNLLLNGTLSDIQSETFKYRNIPRNRSGNTRNVNIKNRTRNPLEVVTLLFSRASSLCSSLALKQLEHLFLLNMLGMNFLHSDLDIFPKTIVQLK